MTASHTTDDRKRTRRRVGWALLLAATLLLGVHLRSVGVFRGLDAGTSFHPDEAKQVSALFNFLHGRYVWYTGSLFYDGYPYGLNHIDEWLLRPMLYVRDSCMRTLYGESWLPHGPSRSALYYWARTLRIIYGILVMVVAYAMARQLFGRRSFAWLVLLLTAIAPLSFCVTHFATGDIGVDLFGGLAMLLLILFAKRSAYVFALGAGLATGVAFGCKYNGILCGSAIALYACLNVLSNRRIRVFLLTSLASIVGCAAGIIVSTPALLINFKRTRSDMFANFKFIKDYCVSDEEKALPFLEKAWIGLTRNSPDILEALGWVVTALALVGLVGTIISYNRRPRHGTFESKHNAMLRARLTIIAFPFIALLLSLTGKLEVQPFHFSYLQVPLIIGAVTGLACLRKTSRRDARLLAGPALLAAILEFGVGAARERFYWQREDNTVFVEEFPATVLASPWYNAGSILRDTTVEGRNVSEFRNRKSHARSPQADVWKRIACAPLPCVPYPYEHEWIFMNGPLFPRNDRMLHVGGHDSVTRHLVFRSSPPAELVVGLRSAAWPVRVVLEVGGSCTVVNLLPDEQEMVTLRPKRWYTSRDLPDETHAYLVPVSIRAEGGGISIFGETTGITATFFANDKERTRYAVFGGGTESEPQNLLPEGISPSNLVQVLDGALFLGIDGCGQTLDADRESCRSCQLPDGGAFLPGGRYVLEADITVLSEEAILAYYVDSDHGVTRPEAGIDALPMALTRGGHQVRHTFSKTLAPYLCYVAIECRKGACRVNSWRIMPDTPAIVDDLRWLSTSGQFPPWARRFADDQSAEPWGQDTPRIDVVFDDTVHVTRFALPSVVTNPTPLRVACEVSLLDFGYAAFDEVAFFIHLRSQTDGLVATVGFTLREAIAASDMRRRIDVDLPADLPVGTYGVQVGMWNGRTYRRLTPSGKSLTSLERHKKRVELGVLNCTQCLEEK